MNLTVIISLVLFILIIYLYKKYDFTIDYEYSNNQLNIFLWYNKYTSRNNYTREYIKLI